MVSNTLVGKIIKYTYHVTTFYTHVHVCVYIYMHSTLLDHGYRQNASLK